MRYLLRSKLAGIVFVLIIISMAVWGVGDIFGANLGSDVVRAGDRGLSLTSFDRKFENYLDNVRNQTGQSLTRSEAVEQGAVDQLFALEIGQMTKLGYTHQIGAAASDSAVKAEIESFDAFKNPQTQKFDEITYLSLLANRRITQNDFEQDIRDGISLSYLRGAVSAAVQAPAPLAKLRASYDGEVRRVAWFVLTQDNLPELSEPTDEELKSFFETRLDGFKEPERRALSVLSISPDDFIGPVEIEDADILAVYEASKAQRFSNPELRVYTQVQFATEAAARKALGQLATGADPADISDVVSSAQNTSLKADITMTDLAEALFSRGQQAGAVFGPFQTNELWLAARLDEIQPGEPYPLESVSDVIRTELARSQAENSYYEAIDGMDDLIGEGLDLATMGERLGVPVMSYMPVDARGISANGAVIRGLIEVQEGFIEAQDYIAGEVSETFDKDTGIYLIQLDKVVPESTPEFEDIKRRIASAYRTIKRSEGVQGIADTIKANIEDNGSTVDFEAAAIGVEFHRPNRGLNRNSQDVDLPPAILGVVFGAQQGDVLTIPSQTTDQVMIIAVETVDPPSEEALSVLTPLSMAELNNDINSDLLQLMEVEIANAISVKTNDAGVEAYKTRITNTQ